MHLFRTFLAACMLFALSATPALAHRVSIFAYANGDTICTESRFNKSTPVHHGEIVVTDAATGTELLRGTTDDKGLFDFPIPGQARAERLDLTIAVLAGEGHRGEWRMPASDYLEPADTTLNDTLSPVPAAALSTSQKTDTKPGPSGTDMTGSVSPNAL